MIFSSFGTYSVFMAIMFALYLLANEKTIGFLKRKLVNLKRFFVAFKNNLADSSASTN